MPGDAKAIHPNGTMIEFNEAAHTYQTAEISDFISSSSIIGKFHDEFDPDGAILKRTSAKRGTTPEILAQEWKDNTKRACDWGTMIHEQNEYHMLGQFDKMRQATTEKEFKVFTQCHLAVEVMKSNYQLIQAEMILFSERFKVAGTIDLVMWDPVGQTVMILDYKTNSKGIKEAGFNNKMMNHPVSNIPDCNKGHYELQLGIYEFLMRHEGYFPPETKYRRALIHLSEDAWTWHELHDRQLEVSQMLLYHKTTHWEDEKLPLNFP